MRVNECSEFASQGRLAHPPDSGSTTARILRHAGFDPFRRFRAGVDRQFPPRVGLARDRFEGFGELFRFCTPGIDHNRNASGLLWKSRLPNSLQAFLKFSLLCPGCVPARRVVSGQTEPQSSAEPSQKLENGAGLHVLKPAVEESQRMLQAFDPVEQFLKTAIR